MRTCWNSGLSTGMDPFRASTETTCAWTSGRASAAGHGCGIGSAASVKQAPIYICIDNGPEFSPHAPEQWFNNSGVLGFRFAWQNGFAERFNRRFRDDFLTTKKFATVSEA